MSVVIPIDICCKFYKLAIDMCCLFACHACERNACIIISKDDYNILCTGVSKCIYEKEVEGRDRRELLYYLSSVEDVITKTVKIGGIALEERICILTHFPSKLDLKLLIQSGVTTIVTVTPHNIKFDECFNKLKERCEIILIDEKSPRAFGVRDL